MIYFPNLLLIFWDILFKYFKKSFQFMELSNYGMFQTRSGLFVNRTARELLFEVSRTYKKNKSIMYVHRASLIVPISRKQIIQSISFPNYLKGSRDPLLDVGSLFAKKGGIPMDK